MDITFITGNEDKAKKFNKLINRDLAHAAIDLPEMQSLDLHNVIDEKARVAFAAVGKPIVVEDVSVVFHAMGRLPGPFIKWFLESMSLEDICSLLPEDNRGATVQAAFAYFDGNDVKIFSNETHGTISSHPSGHMGFGWDKIFIPEGENCTHGELDEERYHYRYANITKPFTQLRDFLDTLDT